MKTMTCCAVALLLLSGVGCGSKSKTDSGDSIPGKRHIVISVTQDGRVKNSIVLEDVNSLNSVAAEINGGSTADVAVELLDAPESMTLMLKSEDGSLRFGLTADDNLAADSYDMKVVVRDRARCMAKETDDSICTNITAINQDYDTAQAFKLKIENELTPTTTTSTSTATDSSTSNPQGGGLFSEYCADLTNAGSFKKIFCALTQKS
jgi:hypothetical protein